MHDAANRVRLPLDQQVHVIGHQAIGVKKNGNRLFWISRSWEEFLIVIIAIEDRLTVIAARDDVIKTTLDFHSRLPSHGRAILFFGYHRVKPRSRPPSFLPPFLIPRFDLILREQSAHTPGLYGTPL